MLEFVKYPSIENHTNEKFIERIRHYLVTQALDGLRTEFVAREKVHGTNFSILITPEEIKYAKRSGIIEPDEKFYGYQELVKDLLPVFESIQEMLEQSPFGLGIQLYGEYTAKPARNYVDYGPKSFYLFDIRTSHRAWDPESDCEKVVESWLSDRDVEAFADQYGLKMAPLIKRGTFDEVLKIDPAFKSTIKGLTWDNMYLERPLIKTDNIQDEAEGFVIKTETPNFLPDGRRILIKTKTERHAEKTKIRIRVPKAPLSDLDQELLNKLGQYATQARINNVISKIGELTPKDFPKIVGMTVHDLLTEAKREGVDLIDAEMQARVRDEITKIVTSEVREIWIDLIN